MFVWAKIKPEHLKGTDTIDFCLRMMDEAEVALAPGRAFGEHGEQFVRIDLVENEQRLRQAMRNLERALKPRQTKRKRAAATAYRYTSFFLPPLLLSYLPFVSAVTVS